MITLESVNTVALWLNQNIAVFVWAFSTNPKQQPVLWFKGRATSLEVLADQKQMQFSFSV